MSLSTKIMLALGVVGVAIFAIWKGGQWAAKQVEELKTKLDPSNMTKEAADVLNTAAAEAPRLAETVGTSSVAISKTAGSTLIAAPVSFVQGIGNEFGKNPTLARMSQRRKATVAKITGRRR